MSASRRTSPTCWCVGPLYRLHATDTNEEIAARQVVTALDAARIKADCALITEAHAGHGEAALNRSVRPTGSSLFLRWPEFGYGMKPLGDTDENGAHRYACHRAVARPARGTPLAEGTVLGRRASRTGHGSCRACIRRSGQHATRSKGNRPSARPKER